MAIRINKEATCRGVLSRAKAKDCVQDICTASLAARELWLGAVSSFPDYPQLLKIGREKKAPIIEAIKNSRAGMVRMMLDNGMDVNASPRRTLRTPLEACVTFNKLDIMLMLIEDYQANPDLKDPLWQTPMFHALKVRNLEALDLLLSHRADPNVIDSFGQTPLQFFMQDKDLRTLDKEILERLLNSGADCNKRTSGSGNAALHYILSNQSTPPDIKVMVVEMLLERRADADITDSKGRTPLHYVCDVTACNLDPGSRCKLINLLIQFGAPPDIQDEEFKSALHLATENDLPKVVETLTENNANPKLRDINGKRPSDLVSKDSDIGSILTEAVVKWDNSVETRSNKASDVQSRESQMSDSSPDLVLFDSVSIHLESKSKRFRTAINRLEDAISILNEDLKSNHLNLDSDKGQEGLDSDLDEVDSGIHAGVAQPRRATLQLESMNQIQTEFYKLKTYAYSLEQDYKNIMKELKLHKNCKGNLSMPDLGKPWADFGERSESPPRTKQSSKDTVLLYKAIKRVSSLLGHDWKMLLRTLECEETFEVEIIIKEIEDKYRGQLREQCYQSLLHWIKKYGREASLDNLLEALSDCDLMDIKDRVESLRDESLCVNSEQ